MEGWCGLQWTHSQPASLLASLLPLLRWVYWSKTMQFSYDGTWKHSPLLKLPLNASLMAQPFSVKLYRRKIQSIPQVIPCICCNPRIFFLCRKEPFSTADPQCSKENQVFAFLYFALFRHKWSTPHAHYCSFLERGVKPSRGNYLWGGAVSLQVVSIGQSGRRVSSRNSTWVQVICLFLTWEQCYLPYHWNMTLQAFSRLHTAPGREAKTTPSQALLHVLSVEMTVSLCYSLNLAVPAHFKSMETCPNKALTSLQLQMQREK